MLQTRDAYPLNKLFRFFWVEMLPEDHLSVQETNAIRYQRRTMKDVCAREKTSSGEAVKNTQLGRPPKGRTAIIMLVFCVISVKNDSSEF